MLVRMKHAQLFLHTCTQCYPYKQVQRYPPLWQLHSNFADCSNGVWHVMKITIAENNLDMGLSTEHFCVCLTFWLEPMRYQYNNVNSL